MFRFNTDKLTGHPAASFFYHGLPWTFGYLCLSSVSIIDAFFLGNYVGSDALAAVTLSVPIVTLIFASEIMLGAGASVRCGTYLGKGDTRNASRIFSQAILTVYLSIAVMSLAVLFFLDPIIGLLGADETLAPILKEYLQVLILFNLFLPSGFVLNYFVSIDGNPVLASASMFVSAATNIFLSWLLITKLDMGVAGVAIGSGVGYFAGFLTLVGHFFSKRKRQLYWTWIRERWLEVFTAAKNGISEGINDLSAGIIALLLNWVVMLELGLPGLVALTIAGIILDIQSTLVFGLGDALQQLVSVNNGAKKYQRIAAFLKLAAQSSLVIGLFSVAAGVLWSDGIADFFMESADEENYALVSQVIILISPVFLFSGINTIIAAYFTGLENPLYSGLIALMGTLVFPVVMVLSLMYLFGGLIVFWAISVAEFLTLLLALYLYRRNQRYFSFRHCPGKTA